MKVISYSLFKTKNINQRIHRDWDKYRLEEDRYWYNIPALYIINSIIYKDFEMRLYVSENITTHPMFSLLLELNKQDNFKMIRVKTDYNNTEPTMWRMIPFWQDVDILLCRDIDSLPTIKEVKATMTFIDSDYLIHTMRTHRQHNSFATRVLAGLCAFKPKEIINKKLIDSNINNFVDYYKRSGNNWGCDQNTLIDIFYSKIEDKMKYFLDSPITTDIHKVNRHNDVGFVDFEKYELESIDILEEIDKHTEWSGEPIKFIGDKLKTILEFDYPVCKVVSDILNNDEMLKKTYLL